VTDPRELLRTTLGDLASVLDTVTVEESWEPSGCRGWSVLDLAFHLVEDAHRALVDLSSPVEGPADTDASGYWRPDRPSPHDGDDRDTARATASLQGGIETLARRHREAVAAVVVAADRVALGDVVRSQRAALTVSDELSHIVVEAAIHHLDLVLRLDRPGPADPPLAEVRRVLEGLYGGPLPAGWDDADLARWGTGRQSLTEAARADLGGGAARFPLLG
jgi:hypothetical protein